MEGDKMTKIPSDEDFARAERLDKEESFGIEEVNQNVDKYFKTRGPLYYFFLMPQGDYFRAYVFFKQNKDIKACEDNGFTREIIDFVYAELERVGRGKREDINVVFEIDSDENVRAECDGDYFMRLR